MSLNQAFLAELKQEAASTRKLLALVPMEKGDWKPHEKSMTLARLANHTCEITAWVTATMTMDGLDFSKNTNRPPAPTTNEELLAAFDKHLEVAIASLEQATDSDFGQMWTLSNGEHVMFSLPKAAVLRGFAFNHQIHHRGQLSVYLRLLDVLIPGMYGPSYDDNHKS